ncbi:hypothetical protein LX36DRAFT_435095 [Colletotrichum falcatum]|nr:hypothetical protein LX36DRAFT_435095 [Colletotrichum falcatum]
MLSRALRCCNANKLGGDWGEGVFFGLSLITIGWAWFFCQGRLSCLFVFLFFSFSCLFRFPSGPEGNLGATMYVLLCLRTYLCNPCYNQRYE